jgi:hypothetical protein
MLSKKYLFVNLRTNPKYILFLIVQLVLSFLVAILGLTSQQHFRSTCTISL